MGMSFFDGRDAKGNDAMCRGKPPNAGNCREVPGYAGNHTASPAIPGIYASFLWTIIIFINKIHKKVFTKDRRCDAITS